MSLNNLLNSPLLNAPYTVFNWGKTQLRYYDLGYKQTALAIPGWAMGPETFFPVHFNTNLLLVVQYSPYTLVADLLAFLPYHKDLSPLVTGIGFSLGGFLLSDLLKEWNRFGSLYFLGVRKTYGDLSGMKKLLKKDKTQLLKGFYKACFSNRTLYEQFRTDLESQWISLFSQDTLLEGLTYLESHAFETEHLPKTAHFIHGQSDLIAPVSEIEAMSILPTFLRIVPNVGHMLPWELNLNL